MKLKKRGLIAFVLMVFISLLVTGLCHADSDNSEANKIMLGYDRENTYEKYIEKYKDAVETDQEIILKGAVYSSTEDADLEKLSDFHGEKDVVKWCNQSGWVQWDVEIPETGLYSMSMKYFPLEGKGGNIELGIQIDGQLPFDNARLFEFCRAWKDASDIQTDSHGNDLRPRQTEVPMWLERDFEDTEGLNGVYKFYFTQGKHKLRIACTKESLAISTIRLYHKKANPAYRQVSQSYSSNGYTPAKDAFQKVQAEKSFLKSTATLYPINDKSSPATEPGSYSKIRVNTIGGLNWKYPGQWITWKFEVPEDGLYNIALKVRQNFIPGLDTARKITIDGKIPFQEMENVKFPYNTQWYIKTLGDVKPYLFYLEKGIHEITMEVSQGDNAEILKAISENVYKLNYLYRKIVMVTGVNPDIYRDYNLDTEIPGLIQNLNDISKNLKEESQRIKKNTAKSGGEAVILDRISSQLDSLSKNPETIGERLNDFKANIGSLAAWILRLKEQSLELDYLVVLSPDKPLPKAGTGIVQSIWYNVMTFFASFTDSHDYFSEAKEDDKSIDVWIGGGRDQAQIVKEMVDDVFTPNTGIHVNLKFVQADLISAVIAGQGPDVAMNIARGQPVNLAMRAALIDLSEFEDFHQVTGRFSKSAMTPYNFKDGFYALPVEQNFHMMFYRKDIFDELGLSVPQTWDDFYKAISVLESNNMEVGLPYQQMDAQGLIDAGMGARNLFPTLLLQNGGSFYNNDNTATTFDTPIAIKSFQEWSDFYTRYSFPLIFDFYNRFRTGEMPLGIASYTTYNMLNAAAPEIRNLWGMAPIPGTLMPDGKINRAEGASGTACVILKGAGHKKELAWEYAKWWTGAEAQARFGRELETAMGVAARYDTANLEAFKMLPWTTKEYDMLMEQWEQVQEIPEIPGGYYTARSLDNAFRKVIFNSANPREALFKYNQDIKKEIERKRQEFGLNVK